MFVVVAAVLSIPVRGCFEEFLNGEGIERTLQQVQLWSKCLTFCIFVPAVDSTT